MVELMEERTIYQAVIKRLPRYYRYLGELLENGPIGPKDLIYQAQFIQGDGILYGQRLDKTSGMVYNNGAIGV